MIPALNWRDADPDERVVVFNTGAAQKYVEVISTELPTLETPVDWSTLAT